MHKREGLRPSMLATRMEATSSALEEVERRLERLSHRIHSVGTQGAVHSAGIDGDAHSSQR
jgi:hypothetical protein